jgi:hypothetical protein
VTECKIVGVQITFARVIKIKVRRNFEGCMLHLPSVRNVKLWVADVRTVSLRTYRVATVCFSSCVCHITYPCSFPVSVVLVHTLCTKSLGISQTVEIRVRAVIMCSVWIIAWWFVWIVLFRLVFCGCYR